MPALLNTELNDSMQQEHPKWKTVWQAEKQSPSKPINLLETSCGHVEWWYRTCLRNKAQESDENHYPQNDEPRKR